MAKRRRRRDNTKIAVTMLAASVVILIILIIIMLAISKKNGGNQEETSFEIQTSSEAVETTGGRDEEPSSEETTAETSGEITTEETSSEEITTQETTTQKPVEETTQPTSQAKPNTNPNNPMSKYEIHEGLWDLASLDNTGVGYGNDPKQRAENMVPQDWAFYESKWGMYNVDWIQDINSNTIYLTMDVGFANDYTEGILDTLKEKNVKVVFFITKMFFDSSPNTVQRMIDEGHIIGNHTVNHPDMTTLSEDRMKEEITTLTDAMRDKFGYEMKLFRFPEGRFSHRTLAMVENLGMKAVFWSYAYNDYSSVQPEVAPSLEKAISYLHPGAIYLLHASSSTNAAFLGEWIDAARDRGFVFGEYPLGAN